MPELVSDFIVSRLKEWGVRRLFGYSGDGINGILGALDRAGNQPEFFQVRHEEAAGLMACAHAKYTGEVGVCISTQGPGAIHLLNGLYDAKLDHQPVVAIVGQVARASLGGEYQQEIALPVVFKDVASAYLGVIDAPEQARHVLDRAFRIAIAERTVTCVIVPHDVQRLEAVPNPPPKRGRQHSSVGYAPPRVLPNADALQRAAEVLNAGERPAILIGAGAMHAAPEVKATAEALNAGVAKALLGKAALADDIPYVTGSAGWLGTAASNQMLAECDTLLMVGTSFPYTEFLPKPGQARAVQIDLDPGILGLRYPAEVNLQGDAALTLRELNPLLKPKQNQAWRDRIEANVKAWWQEADRRAHETANGLNPRLPFYELSQRLPDNAIISVDCGSSTIWYAREIKLRAGMLATGTGTLATMGSAIPYAISAKLAYPDRPVFAFLGDGAMQMSGLTELVTVAKEWRNWQDPRLIALVLNNRDLSYVTWEQRAMEGEARFAASQDLPDVPYGRYAELLGLVGIRVERPEEVGPAWERALSADRPVVIDAVTDPNTPNLPPTLPEQVKQKLEQALTKDPDAAEIEARLAADGLKV
jgi:pyruvate dehydrogenase (quinone)